MNAETQTRFLAAIAKQLPADRVIEAHLFAAIRQGGMESGIAVIALEREPVVSLDVDGGYVPPAAIAEAAELETVESVAVHDQLADESAFVTDETVAREAPYLDEPLGEDSGPPTAVSRYTIYSARYRYTLKGLDRGKWEVAVTEEADAPLLTVDAVVRGVQRRSGDAGEVIRLSGDEFRAALPTV
jgi:hypothetical protein